MRSTAPPARATSSPSEPQPRTRVRAKEITVVTIGVQASTIKASFAQDGTYETLRKVADLGYRAIEISQVAMTPENVAQMRRAQDGLGVKVAALSASLTTPV